jgi:hypothetical protein
MPTAVAPLPISDIISVNISSPSGVVAARQFNQGLIVGPSTRIPSFGGTGVTRLRQYPSLAAMTADGFLATDPEFIAAGLYFGQLSIPQFVWIGRQDLTAISTAIPHSGGGGTGYVVGDIVGVTQASASGGFLTVTTVSAGVVTGLSVGVPGTQGTGYSIATALATTGGTGTGLTVDITAIGETYLQAVQACVAVNNTGWYGFMCCGAVDADHLALAAYSTANYLTLLYFGSTNDVAVLNNTPSNICSQMKGTKSQALMTYSTTQSGVYPNNIYSAAAWLGLYCGLDTMLAASAFTLALKSIAGVGPEPLTQTQYSNITGNNCNVVANFGAYVGITYTGVLESGLYFDQILYRATLVNLITTALMNLLISVPKVPQTDAGEQQLIAQVDQVCAQMSLVGYIGQGTWRGAPVLNLQTGQALPQGFINQAQSFTQQSLGDRQARKAMPIYCCYIEAGAVQFVQVQVYVQF